MKILSCAMHLGGITCMMASNKIKHKVRNVMKFTADAVKEVTQIANEHVVHYNLSLIKIQY